MILSLLVTVSCCFLNAAISADLPAFITPCREKDPNAGDCAVKEANKVLGILTKGVPEIGLPNLVPYKYPDIVYIGPEVKIKYYGGVAKGIAGFRAYNITFDFGNKYIYHLDKIPTLELDGTYDIDGQIFNTSIKATGPFKISMDKVDWYYKLKYKIVNRNGEDYLRKILHTVRLEPQTVKINFEQLFDDAKKTDNFNQQINDNKERLINEILPSVAVMFEDYIQKYIFENIIYHVPYKDVILQD